MENAKSEYIWVAYCLLGARLGKKIEGPSNARLFLVIHIGESVSSRARID